MTKRPSPLAAGTAATDPWKDESGKSRWRGDYGWGESDRKFKFRTADGCEVERKWKKGEYEEKVKGKPDRCGTDTDTLIDLCPIARLPNNRVRWHRPAPAPWCSKTIAVGRSG